MWKFNMVWEESIWPQIWFNKSTLYIKILDETLFDENKYDKYFIAKQPLILDISNSTTCIKKSVEVCYKYGTALCVG